MRRLQIKKRTAVHYIVNKTKTTLSLQIKSDLKKCDFSLDLKQFKVGAALSSCGKEFHAAGPA